MQNPKGKRGEGVSFPLPPSPPPTAFSHAGYSLDSLPINLSVSPQAPNFRHRFPVKNVSCKETTQRQCINFYKWFEEHKVKQRVLCKKTTVTMHPFIHLQLQYEPAYQAFFKKCEDTLTLSLLRPTYRSQF